MIDIRDIPGLDEEDAKVIVTAMFNKVHVLANSMRELVLRAEKEKQEREEQIEQEDIRKEAEYSALEQIYISTCLDIHAVIRDPAVLRYMEHYITKTSPTYLDAICQREDHAN